MLTIKEVRKLRQYIDDNPCLDFDLRTKVLYPLLDEIFCEEDILEIQLNNGLTINYPYRSNIAKEILLREKNISSHAWEPMTSLCVELAVAYKPGNVLIGGAYFGDQALIAANTLNNMKREDYKVICVEPNELQRQQLLSNTAKNNLDNYIVPTGKVLWDLSGEKFSLEDSDSHAAIQKGLNASLESITIEQLAQEMGIGSFSLLQLDIEGSEEKALLGARKFLSMGQTEAPIVITEIHSKYTDWSKGIEKSSLVELLLQHEYKVYGLRDAQSNWELALEKPELVPLDKIYLEGPPHGFNLIAAKDESFFSNSRFTFVDKVASPKYLRHRNPEFHMPMNMI